MFSCTYRNQIMTLQNQWQKKGVLSDRVYYNQYFCRSSDSSLFLHMEHAAILHNQRGGRRHIPYMSSTYFHFPTHKLRITCKTANHSQLSQRTAKSWTPTSAWLALSGNVQGFVSHRLTFNAVEESWIPVARNRFDSAYSVMKHH